MLAAAVHEVDIGATASADIASALAEIVVGADTPGRILICGSLYLAGAALGENGGRTDATSLS